MEITDIFILLPLFILIYAVCAVFSLLSIKSSINRTDARISKFLK